jgi:hypothetical protein
LHHRRNDWSDIKAAEAPALMQIAKATGAEAVSLIPRNDNLGMGNGERQAALRVALKALKPMLEVYDLTGMVEPPGFDICALRNKAAVVEAIEAIGGKGRINLVQQACRWSMSTASPSTWIHCLTSRPLTRRMKWIYSARVLSNSATNGLLRARPKSRLCDAGRVVEPGGCAAHAELL